MKKLFGLIFLLGMWLFMSGFTSTNTTSTIESGLAIADSNSLQSKTILKGRVGVGKALGRACEIKVLNNSNRSLYAPAFAVEFSFPVIKFVKNNQTNTNEAKLVKATENFNVEQYGKEESLFGRKINQQLQANQQPTTLQIFKDARTQSYKAIYYNNGRYLVCEKMVIF